VLICDDHRLLAEGLRHLVEPGFNVEAVVNSGAALLAALREVDADCLLLDVSMPDCSGLDLLPEIKRLRPDLKVLIVTMFCGRVFAEESLRRGAHGFVPKDADGAELRHAITEVVGGRCYVSPRILDRERHPGRIAGPGLEDLTPRQWQVLWHLGRGRRPGMIAKVLGLSPCTLTFHIKNVMRKLCVQSEPDLVRLAVLLTDGQAAPHWGSFATGGPVIEQKPGT
jgi:DNA-binding NarL/FixJ family response regulator